MKTQLKKYHLVSAVFVFALLPLALFFFGDFSRRTILKETLSLLTIVGFSLLLGQFYWARINQAFVSVFKFSRVLSVHKFIGYTVTIVFLTHPFLIVLPRSFEGGIAPVDALIQIVTTFDSLGVLLGLISWSLLLVLGLSSLFRDRLNMRYTSWKLFHGFLAAAFTVLAAWHVIEQGRHADETISIFIVLLAFLGVALLLRRKCFSSRIPTGTR